ncbi:hypothetical protein IWQ62_000007 [Dispira parvispora]|uniref:Uncharacterized protein n=1 Tax=Dispira parvispora TaxID=1520584 RepID=A0A9W8B0Y4_9FUNG|nr:hypothetical protein IWQ62_000007 [Dispira parvispora]
MRAITILVVALIAYCTIVPVSSGSLPVVTTTSPSTVHLARRQGTPTELPQSPTIDPNSTDPGASNEKPDVSKIVAEHPELGELDPDTVYFAFCSKTGESSCITNYEVARGKFWDMLMKPDISEGQRKGTDLLIAQGDATYVRLLFADGTIFCKKSDGTYTNFIENFVVHSPRTNYFHLWGRAVTFSQAYFNTILQKYFARFQFDQEIKDLDKVESTVANQGYTACYDVSMRDGLDAMIKWSVAAGYSGHPQPILEALKPEGRFHSFMLGSLYDSILVNNPDIMNILTNWVDCTKVEESYKAFCDKIQAAVKGGDVSGIEKDSTIIDPDHLSYDKKFATNSVVEGIPKFATYTVVEVIPRFNRGTIDLVRFLDQ